MPALALSVVVPTYNERDNLAPLAARLFATLDPRSSELLVVDDDSPDGTAAACRALAARFPLRCIARRRRRGLASAVVAGLEQARGRLCVVMDADLSHPPEAIPAMLRALDDPRVQMVIGSRLAPGARLPRQWPVARRLNSFVARMLAWPLTPVADATAGFFCVRRADLRLDRLRPLGYKIALELIVRHGWKNIVELPIAFGPRAAGRSKLDFGQQLRYLRHLGRLYRCAAFGRIPARR